MSNRKRRKVKYTCDDCKWNFICKEDAAGKCEEFTLDRVMSDKYADRIIERNRRDFNESWNEYLSEWEDE